MKSARRFIQPVLCFLFIGLFVPARACQHPPDSLFGIIPQPVSLQAGNGFFQFNRQTVFLVSTNMSSAEKEILQNCLAVVLPFRPGIQSGAKTNYIRLAVDSVLEKNKEGYQLEVNGRYISIRAHDGAGLFYGMQTLVQLIKDNRVPGCIIKDYPRFAYRGMHLDVCRHFFSAESVKKWIDVLALYKINTFHWHLTDDQGWRIEIKKYPALQSVSAYRNETMIGHKKELPHVFDGKRYGGYYSQEEIKDVVQYASSRFITIIPEIEMPGHALAALAAYPALGCTGGPYQTATFWGIFSDVYCAGNDSSFLFLEDVLDEVLALFPSRYIHIGGDECPKLRWHQCPKCQKRIADEKLKDENELQSYFIKRIEKCLNSKGRQIIGWDEILEGGLSPGATVMSWTGEHGGIEAARLRHPVVMTPEKFVYLDYYQSLYASEPLAGGGYLPLQKIYEYEPLPAVLTAAQAKYIIGVQANVWTEYMDTEEKAEYMIFPRIIALSEMAWSSNSNRNYLSFLRRLRQQEILLRKLKIHGAENFDEISYRWDRFENKTRISLESTLPGGVIHFTTDGSKPDIRSAVYHEKLIITKNENIRAVVFSGDQSYGRIFEKNILFHKAMGASVSLRFQPAENFNPGATALVNGIEASSLYNDGQWLGFSGSNLEAVIDLGTEYGVHSISTHFLKYHWQRMWEPTELSFWISADGIQFRKVYEQKDFPVNGINEVRAEFPETKTRYVKVIAVNKGVIPSGEYGEGAKAMLMTDEIIVN